MKLKLAFSLFLALVVFIFVALNTDPVSVQFFFWSVDMSLSLLIFIMLATGILIGWLLNSYLRFSRHRAAQKKEDLKHNKPSVTNENLSVDPQEKVEQ